MGRGAWRVTGYGPQGCEESGHDSTHEHKYLGNQCKRGFSKLWGLQVMLPVMSRLWYRRGKQLHTGEVLSHWQKENLCPAFVRKGEVLCCCL